MGRTNKILKGLVLLMFCLLMIFGNKIDAKAGHELDWEGDAITWTTTGSRAKTSDICYRVDYWIASVTINGTTYTGNITEWTTTYTDSYEKDDRIYSTTTRQVTQKYLAKQMGLTSDDLDEESVKIIFNAVTDVYKRSTGEVLKSGLGLSDWWSWDATNGWKKKNVAGLWWGSVPARDEYWNLERTRTNPKYTLKTNGYKTTTNIYDASGNLLSSGTFDSPASARVLKGTQLIYDFTADPGYTFYSGHTNPTAYWLAFPTAYDSDWSSEVAGKRYVKYGPEAINSNKHYYIVALPNEINLTYKLNGGAWASGNTDDWTDTINFEENYTCDSSYIPVRTGYQFVGWKATSNDAMIYPSSGTDLVEIDEEYPSWGWAAYFGKDLTKDTNIKVTLKAQWVPNEGYIYYNANGGIIEGGSHVYIDGSDKYTYTLDGNKIFRKKNSEAKAEYYKTIKYTTSSFNPLDIGTIGLSRPGYYLIKDKEWNTKADGSGTNYSQKNEAISTVKTALSLSSKTGEKMTLYAQWHPYKLTVYYHANINNNDATASTSTYCEKYPKKTADTPAYYNTDYTLIKGPERPGYSFEGWASTSSWNNTRYAAGTTKKTQTWATLIGGSSNTLENANRNIHFFAQWEKWQAIRYS